MHDTAYAIGAEVIRSYLPSGGTVIEIGSADVNGSLRNAAADQIFYVGIDLAPAPGVDIVVGRNTEVPIADGVADLVILSSVLEHDEFFWETFIEACRLTKAGGSIYVNVPSNGKVHNYPIDCWRFYPDAGLALEKFSRRSQWPVTLIESFIARRRDDCWNDFVALFHRDGAPMRERAQLHLVFSCDNVRVHGSPRHESTETSTEDMLLLRSLQEELRVHERQAILYKALWRKNAASGEHLIRLTHHIEQSRHRTSSDLPPDFDPVRYLAKHHDLYDAAVDPYEHYLAHGRFEGRRW